jgi:hypothetical protein
MKKSFVAMSLLSGLMVAGAVFAGDVAQDKKKAAEDRKKGNELNAKAAKAHDQAMKDFDAAVALQVQADADAAEARKFYNAAILEDRMAAKEMHIEQLKAQIASEELQVTYWKNATKHAQDHATALNTNIKNEEKSIADMQAAEKSETNADSKKAEQTVVDGDTADVKNLQDQLKKAQDDEKSDATQEKNHETQLNLLKKHLKDLGG